MRIALPLAGTLLGALSSLAQASAPTIGGEAALQTRWHPQQQSRPSQTSNDNSVAALAEVYWESENRNHSISFSPFGRFALEADARTHADVRELYWNGVFRHLEVRAGISKVFWGKTEILHLVDVINQDDNLENLDGEDKLGQPMLRLSYRVPNGELVGFVLPYFRERAFLEPADRLSAPLKVDTDGAIYESADEETHLDWALRWQGYVGNLDFGLAHFSGTARDPQLVLNDTTAPTRLLPVYPLLKQTSIDAQLTLGSWLLKLEALVRDTATLQPAAGGAAFVDTQYSAATGGFEYTLYGLFDTAADLGLLAEYLWDERGVEADTAFQNDLFLGGRLALNDMAGTALLGGVVMDLDTDSLFLNLEASARLDSNTAIGVQARLFSNIPPEDPAFYSIRNDDYIELEITRYF